MWIVWLVVHNNDGAIRVLFLSGFKADNSPTWSGKLTNALCIPCEEIAIPLFIRAGGTNYCQIDSKTSLV